MSGLGVVWTIRETRRCRSGRVGMIGNECMAAADGLRETMWEDR
jgi:hypothetical protein